MKLRLPLAIVLGLTACSSHATLPGASPGSGAKTTAEHGADSAYSVPIDVSCTGAPVAERHPWNRPVENGLIARETPRHRGIDVITSIAADTQHVRGRVAYGHLDKSLEGESIMLFACMSGAWRPLRMAISNDEGIFDLVLTGTERLPLGMRSLYLVVVGDLTGAQFLALVLAPGTAIAVSDIDGTLTSSENAYPKSLVSHALVKPNDGAPAALRTLKGRGYPLVYVTSRGNRFTQDTRDWLQTNEFPLGPVRLASSLITLPGNETFEYKCQVLKAFNDDKLVVAIGLGNRATDQEAYSHSQCGAPVAANRTFLKMPEFQREVQPLLDRGLAIGVNSYVDVEPTFAALPAASMTESAGAK